VSLATSTDSTANVKADRRLMPRVFTEALARIAASSALPQPLQEALLIALGYYAGVQAGFAMTLRPASVSMLWPHDAVLLAGLLLMPIRSWAVVLVTAFLAHQTAFAASGAVPAASGFVSHGAGPLVGALAFRRLHTAEARLDTFRESVMLLACVGLLAPGLSSLLDAALRIRAGRERVGSGNPGAPASSRVPLRKSSWSL
jgi:integral membrane sensor domain MASE1